VKGIFKCNHCLALSIVARDLNGVLHSLGAAAEQECLFRKIPRCAPVQFFCELNVPFIGSHHETRMQELLRLFADCGDHFGRAVPRILASYATRKVEQTVSVDVFDRDAIGAPDEDRQNRRDAPRNVFLTSLLQLSR
jgi:hypothetical protein